MKRKLILATILVAVLLTSSIALLAWANTEPESAPAGAQTLRPEVQGMQSMLCEIGVKSALKELAGVVAVTVDRPAGTVDVSFDPALTSPGAFAPAVEALGYRALVHNAGGPGDAQAVGTQVVTEVAVAPGAHASAASLLRPEQVDQVADDVAQQIIESEEIPGASAIEEATGIKLSIGDTPVLQQAVLDRLADDPHGQKLLAGSRCSEYGACSVWGNLATAADDILALYEREGSLDGTTYDHRQLPIFEARDLEGNAVSSADLRGHPAVLTLLSVHCNHPMETFPILQKLHRQYASQGIRVIGVVVNSGTVEDANAWVPHFAPEYPMWVVEGDGLGDRLGSHLVPTLLLVDEHLGLRELLVGYQDQAAVVTELENIVESVS